MKVTLKMIGAFRMGRFKDTLHDCPPGTCVQDLIAELQIPPALLGAVLVNDLHAGVEYLLNDGDVITFLPFMDGG